MGISVVPLTAAITERAAGLRARHDTLRLPDVLVLAAAHDQHSELLSYDDRLAQIARRHRKR